MLIAKVRATHELRILNFAAVELNLPQADARPETRPRFRLFQSIDANGVMSCRGSLHSNVQDPVRMNLHPYQHYSLALQCQFIAGVHQSAMPG